MGPFGHRNAPRTGAVEGRKNRAGYRGCMPQWVIEIGASIASREVTLTGAALLANLYAAGILAAMVEVRVLGAVPRRRTRGGIHDRASGGAIALMAVPAGFSIPVLANSVAQGVTLKGPPALFVGLAGYVLVLGLIPLLIEFVALARRLDRTEPPKAEPLDVRVVADDTRGEESGLRRVAGPSRARIRAATLRRRERLGRNSRK